jgi:serine/threonine-protein kinase
MTVLAGRYVLLEQVGEGGMSVVFRARDRTLERDVAVKLLRPFVAADAELRQRFRREARMLAGLNDGHIVRVFDYADDGEQAFLVMEYVEGANLADSTFARLPLALGEAAAYAAPVAQALAYAHAHGVVHRDLTPANILIERESGRVLTSDFGLARVARSAGSLTAPGVLIGTPEYWSPEQALGRESDGATDLYALGCILFLLLSGRLPFEGADRLAVGLRRAHEDAPSLATRAAASTDAVRLVDSLLVREAALRPDAAAAAAALAALADGATARPAAAAALAAARAPTLALASEQQTARLAATTPSAVAAGLPVESVAAPSSTRQPRRRLVAGLALGATAILTGALWLLANELRTPALRAPNVVALRESEARARIDRLLPGASVSVSRAYSTRFPAGRVIRQRPGARERLWSGARIELVVSRGTPYASVPALAGRLAAAARASLERQGFRGRYRWTPSWTTRRGAVIDLRPAPGTLLRRPARVTILVASGYPRAVVPYVQDIDVAVAQTQLAAKHLRTHVVYRLARSVPADQVLRQLPPAGATVYSGTRIRLTVARPPRWVTVFSRSGTDLYLSAAFVVPQRWRIRYRLAAGFLSSPLARVTWARDGDLFADGSFLATSRGAHTYAVADGAGTYRLAITPYAGTSWTVEIDALE